MKLRLYDSASRQIRPFEPLVAGQAGIYVCGPTVQSAPHIGHLRSAVVFDVLARWLRRSGYTVTLIRNVTDIDDKILAKAAEAGVPWWAWAQRFEREFTAAYDTLGNARPTYEPRATGHIPEMIELIQRLLDRGHAYQVGSDVYFDVRSFADYGALTHQNIDDVESAEDGNPRDKKDPRDFALWKGLEPSQNAHASWDTPFGRGRPGWHLECSAMAHKYLGAQFDIHGGGLDLRFPHHENEQAQSRAAGYEFCQTWMHHGWVTLSGEKMSKSVGNTLSLDALLDETSAVVLRYILVSAQYRSMLEFGDKTISDAQASWQRIAGFVSRAAGSGGAGGRDYAAAKVELPAAFVAAMNEDLNVPAGLAVIHETVRDGNTALSGGLDAGVQLAQVRGMLDVLGLDPMSDTWADDTDDQYQEALDALVRDALDERQAAREAKDFARADAIRDKLSAAGITVMDGSTSQTWSITTDDR